MQVMLLFEVFGGAVNEGPSSLNLAASRSQMDEADTEEVKSSYPDSKSNGS